MSVHSWMGEPIATRTSPLHVEGRRQPVVDYPRNGLVGVPGQADPVCDPRRRFGD